MRWAFLFAAAQLMLTGRKLCGQDATVPTLRVQSRLGVANVIVADRRSGEPITTLTASDFLLSANNDFHTILNLRIVHVDHGSDAPLRPLTIWLVTECVTSKRDKQDSAFLRGQQEKLAAGLASLAPEDTVGVAHWCADGESHIDMKPGHDANAAAQQVGANLEKNCGPGPQLTARGRQLGLESLVKLVDYYTIESHRESRPVYVFLHEGTIDTPVDQSRGPNGEGNYETNQLLTSNAICFVINDGRYFKFKRGGFTGATNPVIGPALYAYAYWTGGRQIIVEKEQYAAALKQMLLTLHTRYDLSFFPFARSFYYMDVELTKEARERYPGAELQHRRGFFLANSIVGEAPSTH